MLNPVSIASIADEELRLIAYLVPLWRVEQSTTSQCNFHSLLLLGVNVSHRRILAGAQGASERGLIDGEESRRHGFVGDLFAAVIFVLIDKIRTGKILYSAPR
jgi:hypothetical protein